MTNFNFNLDELFGSVFAYAIDPATGLPQNTPPRRLDYRQLGMADQLPTAVRATSDTALVSNFVVTSERFPGAAVARAGGGTLALIDTASGEMIDSRSTGAFPVSLDPIPTPADLVVTATPATRFADRDADGRRALWSDYLRAATRLPARHRLSPQRLPAALSACRLPVQRTPSTVAPVCWAATPAPSAAPPTTIARAARVLEWARRHLCSRP